MAMSNTAVAQHEGTFYLVGGMTNPNFPVTRLDTIYRYEPSDESSMLMPNRMKFEREGVTAMMVDASLFPACD